jgi:hypothetical protein
MEPNKTPDSSPEESIKLENGNQIYLNIVNNMLKIKILFDSKEYLGLYSLNFFQKDYDFFSFLSLFGIKDCISQRIKNKKYSIENDDNQLKLKLIFDKSKIIEIIIPFNNKIREVSLDNLIRLETEVINLNNRISGIKEELKKEILEEVNKTISKEIENKTPKILFQQKLEYIAPVLIDQKELTEVPYYTREFKTEQIYSIVQVNINIPYTSIDTDCSHGKILTYLDNEMICDSTIHSRHQWELKPLTIIGYVKNLPIGNHKIKILACVDKGTLNLPHLNKGYIEYTIKPIVSGSMTIIGI